MVAKHEPYSLQEERPTLWPYLTAEKLLPSEVERQLKQAGECLDTGQDWAQAQELAESAVALARQEQAEREDGDASILARALYHAAAIMRRVRLPKRAYIMCLEAQPLFERMDDRWRASKLLQLRARCCLYIGEYARARLLIAKAAERFAQLGDVIEQARCHDVMAVAHSLQGNHLEAVKFSNRALSAIAALSAHGAVYSEAKSVHGFLRLRINAAHFHLQVGHHWKSKVGTDSQAMQHAQDAYAKARQVAPALASIDMARWQPGHALMLDTIVCVAIFTHDDGLFRQALMQFLSWSRCWRRPWERGLLWMRLAEIHRRAERWQVAASCARRAARLFAPMAWEPRLVEAQLLLAEMLQKLHDLKGAYEAHSDATRREAQQQRESIAMRAEFLALDLEAEQTLRKQEQTLAYAQRLSNVGHLVASVNHELNQPMASIRMLAETALELLQRDDDEAVLGNMRSMLKLSARLNDVAARLAAIPVQSAVEPTVIDLAEAVDEALAMLGSRLAQTPCDITCRVPAGLLVLAQEGQLVRVIVNLVNNAIDAIVASEVRSVVITGARSSHQRVVLSVQDSGPGLSDSVLERLFQPFFSTKVAGQGLGLGLALSRDALREMGGDLLASNHPDGGALFEIHLPGASAPASSLPSSLSP
jgi:signal transduction histidine kinase